VLANLSDAANTNITLTVREIAPDVPLVALAERIDSVDVLELSGASEVIPLKQRLGEQLANRVAVGIQTAYRLGSFEGLVIAEFPIHSTRLPGRTVRDTRLRELTGLNIVGVWERGRLLPAGPDTMLSKNSVPVIVGTEEAITELDALFVIYHPSDAPVLVIGGGTVGKAACRALRERGASVTVLDSDERLRPELAQIADRVVIGDAANLETVKAAGIEEAPSVVLTTNDDATNIFLTLYCSRLSSGAHIVSRITHEWNLEAIHRAGADFALSHGSLTIQTILSSILGRELIVVGEGTELFVEPIPAGLVGKPLAASGIGAATGLNVIAIRDNGELVANPPATTLLPAAGELVMLGTAEQRQKFLDHGARA
jgi:Trk K+ transport system NAD-binding subunit